MDGKVAVVTGGGGGIGGATCRRFAEAGARVAVFDRDIAAAERVAAEIGDAGGSADAFACDIVHYADVRKAVAAVGTIDALINNAGCDIFRPFLKTTPEEWASSSRST